MGVLKIKTGEKAWKTIDNLNLTSLKINNQNIEDKIQNIADNAAVSIYIEVYSKQFTSAEEGTHLVYKSDKIPSKSDDGYESIAAWFNTIEEKEKKQKGFLIEHRTTNSGTYHLPYYWQVSKDKEGNDTSAWVLLNAIWG